LLLSFIIEKIKIIEIKMASIGSAIHCDEGCEGRDYPEVYRIFSWRKGCAEGA